MVCLFSFSASDYPFKSFLHVSDMLACRVSEYPVLHAYSFYTMSREHDGGEYTKVRSKPTGKLRMFNPEKLVTLGTKDTRRRRQNQKHRFLL
jgi:hypothetical protein